MPVDEKSKKIRWTWDRGRCRPSPARPGDSDVDTVRHDFDLSPFLSVSTVFSGISGQPSFYVWSDRDDSGLSLVARVGTYEHAMLEHDAALKQQQNLSRQN